MAIQQFELLRQNDKCQLPDSENIRIAVTLVDFENAARVGHFNLPCSDWSKSFPSSHDLLNRINDHSNAQGDGSNANWKAAHRTFNISDHDNNHSSANSALQDLKEDLVELEKVIEHLIENFQQLLCERTFNHHIDSTNREDIRHRPPEKHTHESSKNDDRQGLQKNSHIHHPSRHTHSHESTKHNDSSESGHINDHNSENNSLENARNNLIAAREHIPNDNNSNGQNRREFFSNNMREFERRARSSGLSESEIAQTYQQATRLLVASDSAHARPRNERVRIAEQLMMHAADPSTIDQGHLCCNVTTVEDRLFRIKPSVASEVIATTALTGQWTAADGKVIRINPQSLEPGTDEQRDLPSDNHRSEASKMFQVAALNDIGQRRNPPQYFQQRAHGTQQEIDGYWSDASGRFTGDFQGINSQGITQLGHRLGGTSEPFVLMNSRVPRDHSGLVSFSSAEQLGQILSQFKQRGEPAVLVVNAYDPIFLPRNPQIGARVNHVVSITDFDSSSNKVFVDDQHGKRRDHWVELDDLYRATT